jgi:hypothetical protein
MAVLPDHAADGPVRGEIDKIPKEQAAVEIQFPAEGEFPFELVLRTYPLGEKIDVVSGYGGDYYDREKPDVKKRVHGRESHEGNGFLQDTARDFEDLTRGGIELALDNSGDMPETAAHRPADFHVFHVPEERKLDVVGNVVLVGILHDADNGLDQFFHDAHDQDKPENAEEQVERGKLDAKMVERILFDELIGFQLGKYRKDDRNDSGKGSFYTEQEEDFLVPEEYGEEEGFEYGRKHGRAEGLLIRDRLRLFYSNDQEFRDSFQTFIGLRINVLHGRKRLRFYEPIDLEPRIDGGVDNLAERPVPSGNLHGTANLRVYSLHMKIISVDSEFSATPIL